MKAILSIGVGALFLLNSCSNQSPKPVTENNNSNEAKKRILISFIADDTTITLYDDFTVFFINSRDTLRLSSTFFLSSSKKSRATHSAVLLHRAAHQFCIQ